MSTSPSNRSSVVAAVINMKGGVGKTVLSANLFREIYSNFGIKTLLIDFDAQFNLSQLLLTRADYERFRAEKRTIQYIMEPEQPDSVFAVAEDDLECVSNVDDYTIELESQGAGGPSLCMVPGDFRLALMNLREGSGLKLPARRFRSFIQNAAQTYGLVVLDCNPSSSFVTRCALEAATHLVIPVRADKFATLGVELLYKFVEQMPTLTRKPKICLIHNDVRDVGDQQAIVDLRAHSIFGPRTLVTEIKHSTFFMPSSDYTGFATDRGVAHRYAIAGLLRVAADELAKALEIIP